MDSDPVLKLNLEQLNWLLAQFDPIPHGYVKGIVRFLEEETLRQQNDGNEHAQPDA